MEQVSEIINEKFVLLNDFEDSFNRFEFAKDVNITNIKNNILSPFRDEIKKLLNVDNISLDDIREKVKKYVDDRYYVVVMDDASYFQDYDFNFNITRMAYSLEEVKKGLILGWIGKEFLKLYLKEKNYRIYLCKIIIKNQYYYVMMALAQENL